MKGLTIANGGDKNKRRKLDFYPTPPDATHVLMQFLNLDPCKVWECACGNGAMAEVIKEYNHSVISTDISATEYGVSGVDFLNEYRTCDAIITNPPFNISHEFILHATKQAGIVAMLLKSQYWHAKKRIKLFTTNQPSYVLPLTWRPDFGGGGAPTMDVLWTVWVDGDTDTKYRLLSKPANKLMHRTNR